MRKIKVTWMLLHALLWTMIATPTKPANEEKCKPENFQRKRCIFGSMIDILVVADAKGCGLDENDRNDG